jgi:hypothetical protein
VTLRARPTLCGARLLYRHVVMTDMARATGTYKVVGTTGDECAVIRARLQGVW